MKLFRFLVGAIAVLRARRSPAPVPPRLLPSQPPRPRAELGVLALLGLASAAAIAFVVLYLADPDTQLLGLALGTALAALAGASVVVSRTLVPQERGVEERRELVHVEEQGDVSQLVREGGDRITRRRLLTIAATGAGASLGAALIVPLGSLGPGRDTGLLRRSPWRRGRRLVDSSGKPIGIERLTVGGFLTAFPEGAAHDELASPLIVVRLRPDELRLPRGRERWAASGVVAFSSICTHAGCAVSMFRYPLYEAHAPGPALVCPCHYSTFDPRTGGDVVFGPAGRALPQLPLEVDSAGELRAGGELSGAVGPSWWGVRET